MTVDKRKQFIMCILSFAPVLWSFIRRKNDFRLFGQNEYVRFISVQSRLNTFFSLAEVPMKTFLRIKSVFYYHCASLVYFMDTEFCR